MSGKILSKNGLSGILKVCLDLAFFAGIVLGVALCGMVGRIHDRFYGFVPFGSFALIYAAFMACGTIGLFIVYEMRIIFRSIVTESPFCERNVTALRRIAAYGFGICAVLTAMDILEFHMFTTLVAGVFLVFGLFMIVLAEVFRQAVVYKLENDLTV